MMLALLFTAQAYVPSQTCGGTPTHWSSNDLPATWHLRTGVNNGRAYSPLTDAQVQAAVQAGWDVWTDTTTCCVGSTLRLAMVCNASTRWLATTVLSTVSCGLAAWPPLPSTVISN